jgi:hypothetical protein
MIRSCLLASLFALLCAAWLNAARAASPTSAAYTDLHGKTCETLDATPRGGSRLCRGVAGYALVVYENDERASVDIVTPGNALYPLSYWDVVTPGHVVIGQKAEWRIEKHKGKRVPTALLVRLTKLDAKSPGELIAVARIHHDGACVVFRADLVDASVEAAARRAAADPASKCLGLYGGD